MLIIIAIINIVVTAIPSLIIPRCFMSMNYTVLFIIFFGSNCNMFIRAIISFPIKFIGYFIAISVIFMFTRINILSLTTYSSCGIICKFITAFIISKYSAINSLRCIISFDCFENIIMLIFFSFDFYIISRS